MNSEWYGLIIAIVLSLVALFVAIFKKSPATSTATSTASFKTLSLDAGSASNPSLRIDPTTGLYRSGPDQLGVACSGGKLATFDRNGLTTSVQNAGTIFEGRPQSGLKAGLLNAINCSEQLGSFGGYFRCLPGQGKITFNVDSAGGAFFLITMSAEFSSSADGIREITVLDLDQNRHIDQLVQAVQGGTTRLVASNVVWLKAGYQELTGYVYHNSRDDVSICPNPANPTRMSVYKLT